MDFVSIGVAVAGTALALWRDSAVAEAVLESKVGELRRNMESHSRDLRAATTELQRVITDVRALTASQGVLNQMTTKTLENLTERMEQNSARLMAQEITLASTRERVNDMSGH